MKPSAYRVRPIPPKTSGHFARLCLLMLLMGMAPAGFGQSSKLSEVSKQIVIHPEETDEILANPGMGWETFMRPRSQDKNLPDWIPSTVHYARWGWGKLEPEPGKLDTAFLDGVLRETHDAGQKLAFRVMCCSTYKGNPYHPAWLKQVGGRERIAEYGGVAYPIPDLDDPVVLERHLDFIKRLGARYDGHPDLDHLDLGSVGWWGEWHLSGSRSSKLPTLENRMKIVNAYFAAFKKTPLLMLIGGGECLTYAVQHGAGWRADCLGDLGGFSAKWSHMRVGYPSWIRESHIEEVWRAAPVAWESGWDMRKWVKEKWPLRYIFNYALACHASYLNNKSAPLPTDETVRPEVERFLRRLGYRLIPREIRHAPQAKAGGRLELAMTWQNTGSAPCYRPYHLAWRLSGGGVSRTFVSPVTVNHWLPGSIPMFTEEFLKAPADLPPGEPVAVQDAIALPAELPAGTYTLSLAVVDGAAEAGADQVKPVMRLGIKGRDAGGWYPLSKVEVQ